MQQTYDAIIIGGGHNGLTCAAYLAKGGEKDGKNKLKVLVLERREKVGGAAMSEEKYPGFTYSTCSYVCSLLRPEIFRFLDLPRHGLQVIPYDINSAPNPEGEGIIYYSDHDRTRESLRRHSIRDAEAYDEYAMEISRYCRFIKRTLLMTPPDPTQINPFVQNRINPWGHREDLEGLLKIGREFGRLGERNMYDMIRFWSMSVADFLDQYFETPRWKGLAAASSIIGTALGPYSPGTAYVLLHHYMGEVDGQIGAWGFARGGMGSVSKAIASAAEEAGVEIRVNAEVEKIIVKDGKAVGVALKSGEEIYGKSIVSNADPEAHLSQAGRQGRSRRDRSRHPPLCQELQDPRLVGEAEHRARRLAGVRRPAEGVPAMARSISAATSTTSSVRSTTSNTAAGPSGRSSIA